MLASGDVELKPLKRRDWRELEHELLINRDWLQPWEATSPSGIRSWNVRGLVTSLLSQQRQGTVLPFVILYRGELAGQLNVFDILQGSVSTGTVGYWVAERFAGRGITPTAVALATDHLFQKHRLNRVEINIRPENKASLRVVEKLGFTLEGYLRRYIHIDGDWRDHHSYSMLHDDWPGGVLNAWQAGHTAAGSGRSTVEIR